MKMDIHGQHCKTWVYLILFLPKSSFFSTCLICRYSFGCFLIFLNVTTNKSLSIILFNKFCFINNVRATKANLNECAQPASPQFLKTNEGFSTLGLLFWFLQLSPVKNSNLFSRILFFFFLTELPFLTETCFIQIVSPCSALIYFYCFRFASSSFHVITMWTYGALV